MAGTLLILCGGFGFNQFRKAGGVGDTVLAKSPYTTVIYVDDGEDAVAIATEAKMKTFPSKTISGCHSFGWWAMLKLAAAGLIDDVMAADPAGGYAHPTESDWPMQDGKPMPGQFMKSNSQLTGLMGVHQLDVHGGPEIQDFETEDHNSMMTNTILIDQFVRECTD